MPLHRLTRAAAVATVCIAAGTGSTAVAADARPGARYFDIEANKASSMRTLGIHMAKQRANHSPRYHDLEANKARSRRAR